MTRNRKITDKTDRTHDANGTPYTKAQKKFNDIEETIAEVVFGKCTLMCGDVRCSKGCAE